MFIVSGDSKENSINCAISTKFIQPDVDEAFYITEDTIEGVIISLRNILAELKIFVTKETNDNKSTLNLKMVNFIFHKKLELFFYLKQT